MDAVITPHRSLSARGTIVLIGVLTAINLVTAVFFLMLGAGPIPLFLGLDLLAIMVALNASNRAVNRNERVQVTVSEVRVSHQSPRGVRTIWISPTAFTRVALIGQAGDEDEVRLRLSDRELRVGRDLTRPERVAFAKALDRAIWNARAGRPRT